MQFRPKGMKQSKLLDILEVERGNNYGNWFNRISIIFMYGLKLTINDVNLIPAYISALLMILGLLCIRKRLREKYLDYALILTIALCIVIFIEPRY